MPLFENARDLLRANLQGIHEGRRVSRIAIGELTGRQLVAINERRRELGLQPIVAEVVFMGRHLYESRIRGDGYTIEDVIDQISSAMAEESVVLDFERMTSMQNPNPRADRYGNQIKDMAVFECSTRYPRPELYSVVPVGDKVRPQK